MKIMDAVKKDLGKLKNIKVTPKGVKTLVAGGSALMFILNMLDSKNDRDNLKADIMNEMGDDMVEKVIQKLSKTNGES